MALLVVTGLPCSGRTTRAQEAAKYFEAQISSHPKLKEVVIIGDEDIHVDRSVYECKRMCLTSSSENGRACARRLFKCRAPCTAP